MLRHYLKAQGLVLLCGGVVGPIFLAVYFALGPMARPVLNWMFWAGLVVTAADVLAALALANYGFKKAARHEVLTRSGVLTTARVTGIRDTPVSINDQQMIEVDLHIEVPGTVGFSTTETVAGSPTRMQVLGGHRLVALVEPGTTNYEIDWNASGLLAGVVPAEFTVEEDHTTYDLTGRTVPLMQILTVLHNNGIPLSGNVDTRADPVVRQQVIDIVRRAAMKTQEPVPAPVPGSTPTVSQRLQELETLHATGAITDTEYNAKRAEIIADL